MKPIKLLAASVRNTLLLVQLAIDVVIDLIDELA